MSELPDSDEVLQAAREIGIAVSAAELHGALCGWLAGGGINLLHWPAQVLGDSTLPSPQPGDVLEHLGKLSKTQINDGSFAFDLLLPDMTSPLSVRVEALLEWCRGALGGFGLAAGSQPVLSEEGQEALQDMANLAQSLNVELNDVEEDEADLAEIEEFVRVAILLLHGDGVLAVKHRQSLN